MVERELITRLDSLRINNRPIAILCSYVTLGVYIPALLLHKKLLKLGVDSHFILLEELFDTEDLIKIKELKKMYHANFRYAKAALKIASGSNSKSFSSAKIDAIHLSWNEKRIQHFLVFSGFWGDLLNEYTKKYNHLCVIDTIHMDSRSAPSWKGFNLGDAKVNEVRLFDHENQSLQAYISPQKSSFNRRVKQDGFSLLIHGGGWGIGTYKSVLKELVDHEFNINLIAYEAKDIENDARINYHLLNPDWKPIGSQNASFPPIGKVLNNGEIDWSEDDSYYPYYQLVKESNALISKPGGGTLNDCFSAIKPLILLEAFGEHEQYNAELWINLGYGISFDVWQQSGFSKELLRQIREKIAKDQQKIKTLDQLYYETKE